VSNHEAQHPVILTFKAIGGLMPAAKKPAATKKKAPTRKKAPAKKAAPKKAAPKPVEPVKRFVPVHVYLHTNSGESNLTFSSEAGFKAAVLCIESAPRKSSGGRSVPTYTIRHDQGSLSFQTLKKYEIKS
tara:strand:- start:11 stop:400 length:390 start_codon:yes stop_codon:yes gene_type:complete